MRAWGCTGVQADVCMHKCLHLSAYVCVCVYMAKHPPTHTPGGAFGSVALGIPHCSGVRAGKAALDPRSSRFPPKSYGICSFVFRGRCALQLRSLPARVPWSQTLPHSSMPGLPTSHPLPWAGAQGREWESAEAATVLSGPLCRRQPAVLC